MLRIDGIWKSEKGKLIYSVTQVGCKFTWQVVHKNGVLETGIGGIDEDSKTACVSWNFHGGNIKAKARCSVGEIVVINGRTLKIKWDDRDHFIRLS